MKRRQLLAGGLATSSLLWDAASARAENDARRLTAVTVNVFPGGFNWPLFVGNAKGFFARHGLAVRILPTTGSVAQMTGLARGDFDIAMTAVDNIVAYVEGQGEAPIGPQPDFFAFMGSDSGFLSVVTQRAISDFAEIRGKVLSVDANTTGYAFVLFDMLARNGLHEGDYKIVPVGGMTQRWDALQQRKQNGTILSTPYDILAKAQGFRQLAWATHVIGPYQGNVAATRRGWAAANHDKLVSYVRGYAAAIDWLYGPANRVEAIQILRRNLPDMPEHLAIQSYGELLDPKGGFFRNAQVNMTGLQMVLALRSRYAAPKKALTDPGKYYDPRYWDAAMAGRT